MRNLVCLRLSSRHIFEIAQSVCFKQFTLMVAHLDFPLLELYLMILINIILIIEDE